MQQMSNTAHSKGGKRRSSTGEVRCKIDMQVIIHAQEGVFLDQKNPQCKEKKKKIIPRVSSWLLYKKRE